MPPYKVCLFKCIQEMGTSLPLTSKARAREWLRIVCDRHYNIDTNTFAGWYSHALTGTSENICDYYNSFLRRHSDHDVLTSRCSCQLLLFILLQHPQNELPAFCWIEHAIEGFLEADQVNRNSLIRIAQKANGREADFGSRSGFYPRNRCFFICNPRPGEQPLTLHQNTGP